MENLRKYIKEHKNIFIKISKFRGDFETVKAINYNYISLKLDEIEHELGAAADEIEFICEEELTNKVECYDKETEVLTYSGWKLFKDVTYNDKICTLNPISDNIEYQIPINIISRKSNSIYKCKKQKVDFAVTKEHNMLIMNSAEVNRKERKFRKINDLQKTQYYIKSNGLWNKEDIPFFELPMIIKPYRKTFKNCIPIKIDMDLWLKFLGLFLSDGSITRNGYGIFITQAIVHNDERKIIKNVLDLLPFNWNYSGSCKENFRINCYQLYKYLEPFSKKSGNKRIPQFVKELSSRQIRIFLDYFFIGDGSIASNKVTKLYCMGLDKLMSDDIQELLLKSNSNGTVIKKKPQGQRKCQGRLITKSKLTYIVSEHKCNYNIVKRKDINKYKYDDYVYCLTVPNHIIYVRRNGIPMWCGNCGYDGYTIEGQYPTKTMFGLEIKDLGYVGVMKDYKDLPKSVIDFNTAMIPILKGYKYKNFFSTEIRVGKDKIGYMIDFCARLGSPPNELYQEMFTNFSEIIWEGAHGKCIDPIPQSKFAVEILIHCPWAEKNWLPIQFPDKYYNNIKFRDVTVIKGHHYIIPQYVGLPEVGAIVATGKTIEDAFNIVEDIAETIRGYYVDVPLHAFDNAMEEIDKLKSFGYDIFK